MLSAKLWKEKDGALLLIPTKSALMMFIWLYDTLFMKAFFSVDLLRL